MTSENETVASVADCIRHMADNMPNGVILNIAQCNFIADRIKSAHRREVAELKKVYDRAVSADARHAVDNERLKREVAELQRRLKVAEDALEKLQDRLVSSVHDGTIDPHEALEITENALTAIRKEGVAK